MPTGEGRYATSKAAKSWVREWLECVLHMGEAKTALSRVAPRHQSAQVVCARGMVEEGGVDMKVAISRHKASVVCVFGMAVGGDVPMTPARSQQSAIMTQGCVWHTVEASDARMTAATNLREEVRACAKRMGEESDATTRAVISQHKVADAARHTVEVSDVATRDVIRLHRDLRGCARHTGEGGGAAAWGATLQQEVEACVLNMAAPSAAPTRAATRWDAKNWRREQPNSVSLMGEGDDAHERAVTRQQLAILVYVSGMVGGSGVPTQYVKSRRGVVRGCA